MYPSHFISLWHAPGVSVHTPNRDEMRRWSPRYAFRASDGKTAPSDKDWILQYVMKFWPARVCSQGRRREERKLLVESLRRKASENLQRFSKILLQPEEVMWHPHGGFHFCGCTMSDLGAEASEITGLRHKRFTDNSIASFTLRAKALHTITIIYNFTRFNFLADVVQMRCCRLVG